MNASNSIVHRGVWRVRVRHVRLYLRVILTNRALARYGQLTALSPVLPTEAANSAASYDAGQCPLLAQSGHRDALNQCPLLGVKRTSAEGG